ncbi:MATE efflux family protein [Nitzschia inconspicua]|uniref:MATE efflux family protein n=1 Tax=Nitzschia inconspicua TaxID=303405 RepID=A0A9K3KYN0_9STRA|nr:MATE efflux family protein [Nitzschia inconspicua]
MGLIQSQDAGHIPTTITARTPPDNTTSTIEKDGSNGRSEAIANGGDSKSSSMISPQSPPSISAVTLDDAIAIRTDWNKEIYLLSALAAPTIGIQLGVVLPNFLLASQVGRLYGSLYLDGFTLANLMGNLCNLSLLQGIYTASDTLGPQAYCAQNYPQVGLLCIRGVVASAIVLVPINVILVAFFERLMVAVGENLDAARHAQDYYRIFVWALPFFVLYNVTWKFLSAQEIMMPLVLVCLFSCTCILPIGVFGFVQESWLGFVGSAWTIVLFQAAQAILLLIYLHVQQPHKVETWPGLSWRTIRQALNEPKGAFGTYMWLGLGGMLATSEWIYWESLTLLIGTMGVVPLSVHTIPTQVLMVTFMFSFGIAIALAVRLGATLPISVERARKLTVGTFVGGALLFGTMGVMMYKYRETIFSLFTEEEAVLKGAHEIWPKVCVYFFNLCIYALNMGVATGLGQQWMFGIVTVIFLWGLSLPSMYYLCVIRGGGLSTAWACITQPYIVMNAYLIVRFFFFEDWKAVQHAIRSREGIEERTSSEAVFLDNGDRAGLLGNSDSSRSNGGDVVDERTGLLMVQSGGTIIQ